MSMAATSSTRQSVSRGYHGKDETSVAPLQVGVFLGLTLDFDEDDVAVYSYRLTESLSTTLDFHSA